MDGGGAFGFLLENADSIGVVAVAITVAILFTAGIVTERIHVGPEFRRTLKRTDTLDALVQKQTEDLTESRIKAAEARVRIEFLEAEKVRQDREIDDVRQRLRLVETERDRILQTWLPPSTLKKTQVRE